MTGQSAPDIPVHKGPIKIERNTDHVCAVIWLCDLTFFPHLCQSFLSTRDTQLSSGFTCTKSRTVKCKAMEKDVFLDVRSRLKLVCSASEANRGLKG